MGEDIVAMQVHTGKAHVDEYECGLCEYKAKDLEALEMHLVTCETYTCHNCEIIFKNLPDVKTHVIEKHEEKDGNKRVEHIKQNRENIDEFDQKWHYFKDLFPELNLK